MKLTKQQKENTGKIFINIGTLFLGGGVIVPFVEAAKFNSTKVIVCFFLSAFFFSLAIVIDKGE